MPNSSENTQKISYALTDHNVRVPIVDITHPLFTSSIDEDAYRQSNVDSIKTTRLLNNMPGFIKAQFSRVSDVQDSYLSGMRTLIYKLGPNLSKGIKMGFRDRWSVKQKSFMGLRIRLRNISRLQAEILIPRLKESPGKDLCFFNIAGGAASDSLNTLFLILQQDPGLLKGRKIEINLLDLDTFGPNFAKHCVDVLKGPGERFDGLDVTLRAIPYDWREPEALSALMQARVGWIQITASEGGLFEYGSDEEIAQNLNQLYANSTDEMRVTGSLIFDRHNVSQGYLGFAELTGIKIRFLGLEGLNALLSKTGWVLEKAVKIDTIFVVFSLRKKGRDKIELKHGKK